MDPDSRTLDPSRGAALAPAFPPWSGKTLRIGLLGCGVVGSSVARMILEDSSRLLDSAGANIELARVAVRDPAKDRPVILPRGVLTSDADAVVRDPSIDVVIEVIGGLDPPRRLITTALREGKSVITANKELLATYGSDLFATAGEHGVDLHFEASVCGAVPVIRTLRESLVGQRIDRLVGILNGTSNYVLSQMDERGCTRTRALSCAQELGFAERDPSADIGGRDAAAKAAILALLVFGVPLTVDDVETEGIAGVTQVDVHSANLLDHVIKPVAVLERLEDGVSARVHPALVARSDPLAQIRGQFNGVFVDARDAGRLTLYGPGAGGTPTASAIIGDLVSVSRNRLAGARSGWLGERGPLRFVSSAERPLRRFLRVQCNDHPHVLEALSGTLAEIGVGIVVRVDEKRWGRSNTALITDPLTSAEVDDLRSSLSERGFKRHSLFRVESTEPGDHFPHTIETKETTR